MLAVFDRRIPVEGITGSIGTVGDALDNALMESTIGLYKTELTHKRIETLIPLAQEAG